MKPRLNPFVMAMIASAASNARADAIDIDSALRSIIANNPAAQAEIFRRLSNGGAIPPRVSLGEVVFKGNLSGSIRYTAPTGMLPLSPAVQDYSVIRNCGATVQPEQIELGSSVASVYKWENSRALTSRNGLIDIATALIHPATGAFFDSKTTTTNTTFSYGTTETRDLRRTTTTNIPPWTKTTVQLQYAVGSTAGMAYAADFKYSGKVEVAFVREGQIDDAKIHKDPYYCLMTSPPLAGSAVLMSPCDKAVTFKFDNTEGAIYKKGYGCLTSPGLPDKTLDMEECNGRNPNQTWRRNPDGTISGSPDNRLCLASDGKSAPRVQECAPGTRDQQWKIDGYEVVRGTIDLENVIPDEEKRKISIAGIFSGTVANYNTEIKRIDDPNRLSPNTPECQPDVTRSSNFLRGRSPNTVIRRATPDELKAAKPIR